MKNELLNEVMQFCQRKAICETRFGTICLGTPAFVSRLRAGTVPRKTTAAFVRDWMKRNAKKDLRKVRGKPETRG